MSLIVAAIVTAGVALFLTAIFAPLPEATLGAIVVVAISGMANVGEMKRLWKLRRADFVLAAAALTATLFLEALLALGIAVALSLLLLIWRVSRPNVSELGRLAGGDAFGDIRRHPHCRTVPGLLLIRPNAEIFFANASGVRAAIVDRVTAAEDPIRVVLLDLEMTYEIDVPASDTLLEIRDDLERLDASLMLARVHADTFAMLSRAGVIDAIGETAVFSRLLDGLISYLGADGASTTEAVYVAESLQAVIDALDREDDDPAGHVARLRSRLEDLRGELGE
jgi:MFS superfamily sulfate permease-like transporter